MPAAEETLAAHAKRALRTRLQARITAVLDAGIGFLQRLRQKTGGVQETAETEDRRDRPGERRSATATAEPPVEAPKPKRRLRALMIYALVMLIGAAGAAAGAYLLFQDQLDQQLRASQRREAALSKKTRPSAELTKAFEDEQARRAAAEKKLTASVAEYGESTAHSYALLESLLGEQLAEGRRMQAALAETTRASAETRKALAEEQAKRAEAEGKLALALSEHAKSSAEQQKQLAAAEKQLARLHIAEAPPRSVREMPASRSGENHKARPLKTGNCTLDTHNVNALKDCLENFNR